MSEELKKALIQIDEIIEKGGQGSGVKGHTTAKILNPADYGKASDKPKEDVFDTIFNETGPKRKLTNREQINENMTGIHKPGNYSGDGEARGQSYAGLAATHLRNSPKVPKEVKEKDLEASKNEHRKVLAELKAMPKPNLTKAEEQEEEQMDELLNTLKKLGKEGLKKAFPTLSPEQQALVTEALTKAKDMTAKTWGKDNDKPQKRRDVATTEVSNDPKGVNAIEEELMDDENADAKNQGGSHAKVEGWSGQVIKGGVGSGQKGHVTDKLRQGANEARMYDAQKVQTGVHTPKFPYPHSKQSMGQSQAGYLTEGTAGKEAGEQVGVKADPEASRKQKKIVTKPVTKEEMLDSAKNEHRKVLSELKAMPKPNLTKSEEDFEELVAKAMEICGDEKQVSEKLEKKGIKKEKIEKALEKLKKKQGVPEGVDPAKQERCVKEVKAQGHDKSSAFAICNASMKKAEKETEEPEVEMPAKEAVSEHKRLVNVLESDSKEDDKKEAKKQKKELKEYEEKAQEEPKMEKSVVWGSNDLLKANTLGRNAHYSVDEMISKSFERNQELKKSGDTFQDGISESLVKNDSKKLDLNTMIEQGLDRSEDELKQEKTKAPTMGACLVKSFTDEDMDVSIAESETLLKGGPGSGQKGHTTVKPMNEMQNPIIAARRSEDRNKMTGKTGMVRASTEANQNQKGVHQTGNMGASGGISEAGSALRSYGSKPEEVKGTYAKDNAASVKEKHKEVLAELKAMPKPNLTKGETQTEVMEIKLPQPKNKLKVKDTNKAVEDLYNKKD